LAEESVLTVAVAPRSFWKRHLRLSLVTIFIRSVDEVENLGYTYTLLVEALRYRD
jgi:hypothetical protein